MTGVRSAPASASTNQISEVPPWADTKARVSPSGAQEKSYAPAARDRDSALRGIRADSCVKITPTATETKKTVVMNASRVRKIVLDTLKLSFTANYESELI